MDIKEILEDAGYEVVEEAADGFDAGKPVSESITRSGSTDVKMPLLDGLSAANDHQR